MKVKSHFVGTLGDKETVQFIALQTASPFLSGELQPYSDGTKVRWDDSGKHRADLQRTDRIRTLVNSTSLLQSIDGATNTIIALPEYSVPKIAHSEIDFQAIADMRKAIIIPGSYWEDDDKSDYFGQHIARIYTPGKKAFLISKRHPTPREEKWMRPSVETPSIGRLWWSRPNGDVVDVSVFLCRDYLASTRGVNGHAAKPTRSQSSAAKAEFSSEGANVVLMHNKDAKLFDGVAGVDLRAFRGAHRMALFVNSASASEIRGTTFIGATADQEAGDVVRSIAPTTEGVLSVETRLWNIKQTTQRPDTRNDSPVRSISAHRVVEPELILSPVKSQGDGGSKRAVWRPAFLEAIGMGIVIEFYAISRDIVNVERRFVDEPASTQDTVKNVYAGIVRGPHDVAVRRYVKSEALDDPDKSSFLNECAAETGAFLRERLRSEDAMVLSIRPRDILKYRGRNVEAETFPQQLREAKAMFDKGSSPEIFEARSKTIKSVLSLADSESCDAIPSELSALLFDEPEEIIPVQNNEPIRETYIFISRRATGRERLLIQRFDDECIKTVLMQNEHVREIFAIHEKDELFQFLIKLKCSAADADKIGRDIRVYGEQQRLSVNTRTIDFASHLSLSSLSSVNKSLLTASVEDLVTEMREHGAEDLVNWANKIENQKESLDLAMKVAEARSASIPKFPENSEQNEKVFSFFSNLLFHSIERDEVRKRRYLEATVSAWRSCYDDLEECSQSALKDLFERGLLGDKDSYNSPGDALREGVLEKIPDTTWRDMRKDKMRLLYEVLSRSVLQLTAAASEQKKSSARLETRSQYDRDKRALMHLRDGYRNKMTHISEELAERLSLTGDKWEEKLKGWEYSIIQIYDMLPRVKKIRELAAQDVLERAS